MADEFANIVTDEHMSDIAMAIREVLMIDDDMTILDMPEKIRFALVTNVDGGAFTDIDYEGDFDAGLFTDEDHLVFDAGYF